MYRLRPCSPRLVLPLLSLAVPFLGCATAPRQSRAAEQRAADVLELENRATLLMLADRRELLRPPLELALGGGPRLREELAVTLGRIADPAGRPMLEGLLLDEVATVRRAAAFALGELGAREAGEPLLIAATDADAETGTLAVESLGKLGWPVAEVAQRLAPLGEAEAAARLLPHLFRFREAGAVAIGSAGLARPEPALRRAAAYGLARYARVEAAPLLRILLGDRDAFVRGIASRGLGEVGETGDLVALRALVESVVAPPAGSAEEGAAVQAMRAAARLQGKAAAGEAESAAWHLLLAERFLAKSPALRITALEAAASFVGGELEPALLERFAAAESEREQELALLALGRLASTAAHEAIRHGADSASPVLRAAAAQGAGRQRDVGLLARLGTDSVPRVRVAVLEARLASDSEAARNAAAAALADPDATVRATALDWWTEHPELGVDALAAAAAPPRPERAGRELEDDRLAAVRALAVRSRGAVLERGACLAALDALAHDASYLVRREAIQALRGLGEPAPPLAPLETRRPLSAYRQILEQTSTPRYAALETTRGRLVVELACPQAPMTCLSFLQLAEAGYFDGQVFHRVVADFVVQGGDPRGDGWGGPGYALRDEVNRLRYEAGALGMALSGPDTGGSQFFLTLSPQPHLDGGYTVFGRLIAGSGVLPTILQGDGLLRVREVERPADRRGR